MVTKGKLIPWPIATLISLIAFGYCYGFYAAFAYHDEYQISAALKNWPFLLLLICVAVASWKVKKP